MLFNMKLFMLFCAALCNFFPMMWQERGQLDLLIRDLEAFVVPASLKWIWKEESQGTALENSWTDLVKSYSTLPKKQRHQQAALWEFVQTELIYINKLKIIKD
ncbi:hypothetical protein XENORESO_019399, partial [Xenotaenia resolanae]